MKYGKKVNIPMPMPKPRRGTMNEMMGSAGIMQPVMPPVPKPKPKRKPRKAHNTSLGKYAE